MYKNCKQNGVCRYYETIKNLWRDVKLYAGSQTTKLFLNKFSGKMLHCLDFSMTFDLMIRNLLYLLNIYFDCMLFFYNIKKIVCVSSPTRII